jgi:hypothetical protein
LDSRRLWKQCLEAKTLLKILWKLEAASDEQAPQDGSWREKKLWRDNALKKSREKIGWANHHAVTLWIGFSEALAHYYNCHVIEWEARGYNNNSQELIQLPEEVYVPFWTQLHSFHQNHRAALIEKEIDRKEKIWYQNQKKFLEAPKFVDYVWEP